MLHLLFALALFSPPPTALASTSIVMAKAGDAVVTLTISDSGLPAVTALDVTVDGEVKTTVLVFGKIGHPPYTALLHALPAGRHEISAQPSPYWTWPASAAAPGTDRICGARSIVVSARAGAVAAGRHHRNVDGPPARAVCRRPACRR